MGSKQIFLVDDDVIFRTASSILLKQNLPDYGSVPFENGEEACDALLALTQSKESLPELMFLDINMPVMNGWEVLEELKTALPKICQDIKIYILTSSIAPEDMNLSKTYDFINGYITKPLTTNDIDNIKEVLE